MKEVDSYRRLGRTSPAEERRSLRSTGNTGTHLETGDLQKARYEFLLVMTFSLFNTLLVDTINFIIS